MQKDVENTEERISKINTAGLQNFRRNDIWEDANNHSRKGMYKEWNEDLDRIWLELVGTVKEGSDEEKEFIKINKECFDKFIPLKKRGFESLSVEDYKKILLLKSTLMKKETFLRRLEDRQGKGTAYEEDDDYMD